MTIAPDRTRSLLRTREFLLSLLDPKQTPHTPKSVREEARRLSKHFPGPDEVNLIAKWESKWLDASTAEAYLAKHGSAIV